MRACENATRPEARRQVVDLEFPKVWKPLQKPLDAYALFVLPWLGKRVANDAKSYRYLAESIRTRSDHESLKMQAAGVEHVEYFNLAAGIVVFHIGTKF